jgi:hypothetical protein
MEADASIAKFEQYLQRLGTPPPQPLPPTSTMPPATVLPDPAFAPASAGTIKVPEPRGPDWDSWASDLPEAIRQANVEYVKRRYPS